MSNPIADDILMHYGMPRRSGRYPWGSGENPYQHNADFLARVEELENTEGMSAKEVAKLMGMSQKDYDARKFQSKVERRNDKVTTAEKLQAKGFSDNEIMEKMNLPSKSILDSLLNRTKDDDKGFVERAEELEKEEGMSSTEAARFFDMTSSEYRTLKSMINNNLRQEKVTRAKELQAQGLNATEIAREMGLAGESSVRSLLNSKSESNMNKAQQTAEFLKEAVKAKGMIDIGDGVEHELGISREKLREAKYILEKEGYKVYNGRMPQVTNKGKFTTLSVLCPPGTEHKEIYNLDNVHSLNEYEYKMTEGGNKRKRFEYPESLDSKRLAINYAEDGGIYKDGVIELRRGVDDISLGNSNYAQVRIMVDGTHYLKGMAVYSDDLPKGIDVRFNTNKHAGTPMEKVLKPIKDDPDNPFGSLIKDANQGGQRYYDDPNGKYVDPDTGKRQSLSVINKRADEGDWDEWSNSLSSQFLAKQNKKLIDQQLSLTKANAAAEFDSIMSLTNPTVKRKLLNDFASECDSAAVHLKAASLPRQRYQVILPIKNIKEDQIYAPNYKNGEQVALIRYPHGGTFEIAILTVNNRNVEGQKVITSGGKDAVGIHKNVADKLSGADFDGDTVMVIPTGGKINITARPSLKKLEGFDPKEEYGKDSPGSKGRDYPLMKEKYKQTQMGVVSNLITDMTQKGANDDELARAVRHSMVVIDAVKHGLDYKRSYEENGIAALKEKYQGHYDENGRYKEGASTIMSAAKNETSVPKRIGSPYINSKKYSSDFHPYVPDRPEGALIYKTDPKDNSFINKDGKLVTPMTKSNKMSETDDAMTLVSNLRTRAELAYADYANYMKHLGNEARKAYLDTGTLKRNPTAAKTYEQEVNELDARLVEARKNRPKERQAQRLANTTIAAKVEAEPGLKEDKSAYKKVQQIALTQAREKVGASRSTIEITDKQWQAIQSGAISDTKLAEILKYANPDRIRELATPKTYKTSLSSAQINRISSLSNSGFSNSEIAERLGISVSTVVKYLKGK